MLIRTILEIIKQTWETRTPYMVPLLLISCSPILYEIDSEEMVKPAQRCLYVLVVMAATWLTESLPISATALMPLVLFPPLQVMTAGATAAAYINNTSMLFLGGLIVAVAVEEWNLHKRIALLVMLLVGSDPKFVMAGLMVPTWFLSMWISNTATASMMIPIAAAVLQQIKIVRFDQRRANAANFNPAYVVENDEVDGSQPVATNGKHGNMELNVVPDGKGNQMEANGDVPVDVGNADNDVEDPAYNRLCKGLSLCIAYAANIGGIATLTGTPPNLVLEGQVNLKYEEYQRLAGVNVEGSPISYSNWMGMAVPLSLLVLVLAWALLVIIFILGRGCCSQSKEESQAIKAAIRREWRSLGTVSMAEVIVLCCFVLLAVLWISRDPKESPGWNEWFEKDGTDYVSDSTSAMFVAMLLFILPAKVPNIFCIRTDPTQPAYTPILNWKMVNQRLPWGVIVLLGGGFALAKGVQESGLDDWLGEKLETLDSLEDWQLNLVLTIIVAVTTEVTSNTATATLLMPILANLAISLEISPMYLMSSAALATSFAFMLPVATPPNAIVFSFGHVRVVDMAFAGFFMNIIAVGCLNLAVNTWGSQIYDFDEMEDIFRTNNTA